MGVELRTMSGGVGSGVGGVGGVGKAGVRATVAGSGLGGGNQAGLPLSLPRNHCGSSGIVCTALFRAAV